MDNYSGVGLGVRTRVSRASHHHHLLLWGHGNLSNRTDHLANGWLQLKTITIPSRPMDASPKSIAIPLEPMITFQLLESLDPMDRLANG